MSDIHPETSEIVLAIAQGLVKGSRETSDKLINMMQAENKRLREMRDRVYEYALAQDSRRVERDLLSCLFGYEDGERFDPDRHALESAGHAVYGDTIYN